MSKDGKTGLYSFVCRYKKDLGICSGKVPLTLAFDMQWFPDAKIEILKWLILILEGKHIFNYLWHSLRKMYSQTTKVPVWMETAIN